MVIRKKEKTYNMFLLAINIITTFILHTPKAKKCHFTINYC